MVAMSAYPAVVTSPATCTRPVVTSVSTATRLRGSSLSSASRIASLIWSAILSGWPSVTDSEVNRRLATGTTPDVGGVHRDDAALWGPSLPARACPGRSCAGPVGAGQEA